MFMPEIRDMIVGIVISLFGIITTQSIVKKKKKESNHDEEHAMLNSELKSIGTNVQELSLDVKYIRKITDEKWEKQNETNELVYKNKYKIAQMETKQDLLLEQVLKEIKEVKDNQKRK